MNFKPTILLALGLIVFCCDAIAQDKLLLTNGKIKDLNGEVVHADHLGVFYQRWDEKERERLALERQDPDFKGHIWELYGAPGGDETAEQRFAEEIAEKMAELTEEEFEAWKKKRYLELKEKEVSGTFKDSRKWVRTLRRYTKRVKNDQVFSILRPDGSEEVVYKPDTLGFLALDPGEELDYNIAEMRAYIKGRQDGRQHSMHDIAVGAGIGYVSGLVGTAAGGAFYTPAVPAVAMVIMSLSGVKIDEQKLVGWSDNELDAYRDGYEKSAKNRKILGLAIGSAVGLGIGVSVGILERPYLN